MDVVWRCEVCDGVVLENMYQRAVERDEVNLMDDDLIVGRKMDWIEGENS